MFRLAGRFIWQWGAGLGNSGPVIVTEGPAWVSNHHMIQHRMTGHKVKEHVMHPGRTWAQDRTLMTFDWSEGQ